MWKYKTKRHILMIVKTNDGQYGFMIDDDPTIWEACQTPEDEASNISCHVTGCDKWDSLDGIEECSESLSEWIYVPEVR